MEIVNFGHFKPTSTTGIMFFANEEGQDWYDLRKSLTTWDERGNFLTAIYGAWAVIDPVTLRVTNVEYDPSRIVPMDRIVLGMDAEPEDIAEGMIYQDGTLSAPAPEPAPFAPVTGRQLRLTLVRNGISLESVEATIAAMPEGLAKQEAQIEWAETSEFNRQHPTLLVVANALSLTEEQVDAMWRQAEIA